MQLAFAHRNLFDPYEEVNAAYPYYGLGTVAFAQRYEEFLVMERVQSAKRRRGINGHFVQVKTETEGVEETAKVPIVPVRTASFSLASDRSRIIVSWHEEKGTVLATAN